MLDMHINPASKMFKRHLFRLPIFSLILLDLFCARHAFIQCLRGGASIRIFSRNVVPAFPTFSLVSLDLTYSTSVRIVC